MNDIERVTRFRERLAAVRAEDAATRDLRLSVALDCVLRCEIGMARAMDTLPPNHPAYAELRLLVALCRSTATERMSA